LNTVQIRCFRGDYRQRRSLKSVIFVLMVLPPLVENDKHGAVPIDFVPEILQDTPDKGKLKEVNCLQLV